MKKKHNGGADNCVYLLRELYAYRHGCVILLPAGSVLPVLLSLITIAIPKIILDRIAQRADGSVMLAWIVGTGIGLFLVSAANLVVQNQIISCSEGFLYTFLVRKWEERMMDLDYELFSSQEGKLSAEKARNSISSPNWGVVTWLGRTTALLESAGGLLVYGTMIGALHPVILAILLIFFGIEMWYGAVIEKKNHQMKGTRASVDRKLNYIAYGTKGMAEGKDIRMYSMLPWLRQKTREAIRSKDRLGKTISGWERKKMDLGGMLVFLRSVLAYGYLIYLYFYHEMTIGDFTLYFAAITRLGNWLGKLTQAISGFLEANNYVTDFRQFMTMEIEKTETRYRTEVLETPVSFTWEHVSFSYWEMDEHGNQREIPVLKDVNLEIKAGEKLAIVGVNGAGKTTFVKLLCGLLKPKEGTIFINGLDSREFDREDYFRLFSAVFQRSGVLPVSIRENVALNIREQTDEEDVWNCLRLAGLARKVQSLPDGIDTCLVKRISEHGTELSGGELQRLLLARALYKNAPVLILDEPTAALDPIAEHEIYEKYRELTEGKTSIFISHRLASTRFCDRILVMEEGRILESGTHEELTKQNRRYAEMFEVQSRYYREEVTGK